MRLAGLVLILSALLAAPAALLAQTGRAGGGHYLGRSLTDQDFLLYFQYIELNRQNVAPEALASFAAQNGLDPAALASLADRINYGRLIIENPALAGDLVATYGPAIAPTDQERLLFERYSADLNRLQNNN
jgi:hypothetical protein